MSVSRLGRIALGIMLATALVLTLTACAGGGTSTGGTGSSGGTTGSSSGGGSSTMAEKNYQFSPATLAAAVGDTVSFPNNDAVAHHVVVGTTDLGIQQPGATVTWTATTNGTFAVKCLIHPSMVGQITVGSGGAAAPSGTGGAAVPPATGGSSGGGY